MVEKYPDKSRDKVKEEPTFIEIPVGSHYPKSFNRDSKKSISSSSSQQNRSGNEVSKIMTEVQLGLLGPGRKMTVTSQRSRREAAFIDEIENAERALILNELQRYHDTRRMFLENMEYLGETCPSTIRIHPDDSMAIPEDGFSRKSVTLLQSKELFHRKAESLRHNLILLLKEKTSAQSHISPFVNFEDSTSEFDINDQRRSQTSERISPLHIDNYNTYNHSGRANEFFSDGTSRKKSRLVRDNIDINDQKKSQTSKRISPHIDDFETYHHSVRADKFFYDTRAVEEDTNDNIDINDQKRSQTSERISPLHIDDYKTYNHSGGADEFFYDDTRAVEEDTNDNIDINDQKRSQTSERIYSHIDDNETYYHPGGFDEFLSDDTRAVLGKNTNDNIDINDQKRSQTSERISPLHIDDYKTYKHYGGFDEFLSDDTSRKKSRLVRDNIDINDQKKSHTSKRISPHIDDYETYHHSGGADDFFSDDTTAVLEKHTNDNISTSEKKCKSSETSKGSFISALESHSDKNATHGYNTAKDDKVALQTKIKDDPSKNRSKTVRGTEVTLRAGNAVAITRNVPFRRHSTGKDELMESEKKPKSKGKVHSKSKCGYNN